MTHAVKMEITVRNGFNTIMVINVAIMDITELMICGILWLKSCLSVSTSLV